MINRIIITILVIFVVGVAVIFAFGEKDQGTSKTKPNVVFIMADDLEKHVISKLPYKNYNGDTILLDRNFF